LAFPPIVKRKQNSLTKKPIGLIKTHGNGNLESITSLLLDKEKTKTKNLTKTKLSASIVKNRAIS
ncbi:hypothetical protein HN873_001826, partial [Arachis hypogaea]